MISSHYVVPSTTDQEILRIWHTVVVSTAQQQNPDLEPGIEQMMATVGTRLRDLRHVRAMTLHELAQVSGLPPSTLSRVETGQRRPSLEILLRLAKVHHLTLDELIDAPATGDPRIHVRPSVRYGMTWIPLTRRPGGIQAYKLIIPVGYPHTEPELRSHTGYEWIYLLDGRLRLLLGEHDLVLTPGEIAEFDTHTPHAFTNPGTIPTELLMLVGVEGQRAHVRARPSRHIAR